MYSAGMTLYVVYAGLLALLCGLLWKRRIPRDLPLFSAYIAFSLAKVVVLFPWFYAGDQRAFGYGWWAARPLELGLALAAILRTLADLYELRGRRWIPTLAIAPALVLGIEVMRWNATAFTIDRSLRAAICILPALALFRIRRIEPRLLALLAGLSATQAIPAIAGNLAAFRSGSPAQFIPTASSVLAIAVFWIPMFAPRSCSQP